MWNTTLDNARPNKLVLAKIKPSKWIDGGYEIGRIIDKWFWPQEAKKTSITLDRIERWIEIDELERILKTEEVVQQFDLAVTVPMTHLSYRDES